MLQPAKVKRTNDFAFKLANVNGTGSASANGLIMQAIFRMGIPVSGKNLFPSNIQGLPTWYEVRVNQDGYTARTPDFDLMVAMNAETYAADVREVVSGGYILYDSTWPLDKALHREDVTFLGVPLAKMCTEAPPNARAHLDAEHRLRRRWWHLSTDMDVVVKIPDEVQGKELRESNHKAIKLGYDYAVDNFQCPLPIHLSKSRSPKIHPHRRQHRDRPRLCLRRSERRGGYRSRWPRR